MLHEVIACLFGSPGCFFVQNENDGSIQLQGGLDFLHPAEKVLLERLCYLGNQFKKICDFADGHLISRKDSGSIYGLYACAFASGLIEVLQPYRTELWKLELEAKKDPHFSLTHLLQLERYLPLFQHLHEVIHTLVNNKTHGCKILEVVYKASHCGLPMVETSLLRILKRCHMVLLRQIRHWMICGTLSDPDEELFITEDKAASKHPILNNSNSGLPLIKPKLQYCLRLQLLPSYIPIQVASKILFVGQCAGILGPQNYPMCDNKQNLPNEFDLRQEEFTEKLLELSQMERFSILKFTSVVAEIRACAAEQMWKVIVEESDFLSFLKLVKDFYLLGRGELYQIFIDIANKSLKMPLTTATLIEAKSAFALAVFRSSLDNDSIADRFKVILQEKKEDPQTADKDSLSKTTLETGWSTFGLMCKVPHPLDIVFTPSVLNRYNLILRFLLNVRRVQIELNQCFVLQLSNKGIERNSFLCLQWQLRSHMAFLIDNFQYYLQVDVLDSQFSQLVQQIQANKDFETIQGLHLNFLIAVTSQSFQHLKPVYFCLLDILDLCSSFCSYIIKNQNSVGSNRMTSFENIRLNFQRQTSLLFRVLCGIKSHQVSPNIAQFLLRLDYNRYLSSSGGHLGGPQVRKL